MSRPLTPVPDSLDVTLGVRASHHSQQSIVLESDHDDAWRKDTDCKRVAEKLLEWRDNTWEKEYPDSYLPVDIIIDDDMIQQISKSIRLCQPEELKKEWGGFERFGGELLLLVEEVDEEIAREKSAAQELTKATTAAVKAQQNRLEELTDDNASQGPPACRTPVFDPPGTGVFQFGGGDVA